MRPSALSRGAILPGDFLERLSERDSERWYTYPISPCSFFFSPFLFLCFRKTRQIELFYHLITFFKSRMVSFFFSNMANISTSEG